MTHTSYNQFCPTAMACEMLEPRWTMLLLCEIGQGSTRFSDIRRGVPGMSPSLLSRRLKEMEEKGLLRRELVPETGQWRYHLTPMAEEAVPLISAIGEWAHRNLDPGVALDMLDDRLLMWNLRRNLRRSALPARRAVVQFILTQPGKADRNYWLIAQPGTEADLCSIDPRFDVDLYVTAELRALTSAWMGHSRFEQEIRLGRISLVGDAGLAAGFTNWVASSGFARGAARCGEGERRRA